MDALLIPEAEIKILLYLNTILFLFNYTLLTFADTTEREMVKYSTIAIISLILCVYLLINDRLDKMDKK